MFFFKYILFLEYANCGQQKVEPSGSGYGVAHCFHCVQGISNELLTVFQPA